MSGNGALLSFCRFRPVSACLQRLAGAGPFPHNSHGFMGMDVAEQQVDLVFLAAGAVNLSAAMLGNCRNDLEFSAACFATVFVDRHNISPFMLHSKLKVWKMAVTNVRK